LERKSSVVLLVCFSFIFGIIAHSFINYKFGFFWLYNLLLLSSALIIIFWQDKKMRLIFLGAFFIIFGFARFDLGILDNKIFSKYYNKEVKINGLIVDEPINKIDKQQLVIAPEEIGGKKFEAQEKILITTNLYPKYNYGERLSFNCKLQTPKKFEDFDYAKWLSIQDVHGVCYWPEIQTSLRVCLPAGREPCDEAISSGLPRSPRSLAMAGILKFKNFLIEKTNYSLHEPYASFLSGLILGARNSMPPDLLENFKRAGITHIIAISGWNISFLSYLFFPAFFYLGMRRGRAFYGMLVLIFLYVLLTGAGASVIRAGVMGAVLLLAQKTSRLNRAGRALLYAVAVMFILNPRTIYDAGFWLSFSATFGLIYFAPFLDNRLCIKSKTARGYISATVTAIIFTLPVSSYIFGGISLWALVANLAVLPFVPPAFVASLSGLLAAAIFPENFADWAFLPAASILNYIIAAANFFGKLPGYLNWRMPIIIVIVYYAGLLFCTIKGLAKRDYENE